MTYCCQKPSLWLTVLSEIYFSVLLLNLDVQSLSNVSSLRNLCAFCLERYYSFSIRVYSPRQKCKK